MKQPIACAPALALVAGLIAATPTPAIANPDFVSRVSGECVGYIALTPQTDGDARQSRGLWLYDCAKKDFAQVEGVFGPNAALFDLTFTDGGYRYFEGDDKGGKLSLPDRTGALVRQVSPPLLDIHDAVVEDGRLFYMRSIREPSAGSCWVPSPIDLQIDEIDGSGAVLWTWTSRGKISPLSSADVIVQNSYSISDLWRPKDLFMKARDCYTTLLARVMSIKLPALFLGDNKNALIGVRENDYMHANSIQKLPSGDLLVSARHLDTIFTVSKADSRITWCLGGDYSNFCSNKPAGDPRGGFSHQHSARIFGDEIWLFDNGNRYKRASRVAVYKLDASSGAASFVREFVEPNGEARSARGSVQVLPDGAVLVGWGTTPKDARPHRAVSLFTASGQETFFIDFAPKFSSYRANWSAMIWPQQPRTQ